MLLKVEKVERITPKGYRTKVRRLFLQCDNCDVTFEKGFSRQEAERVHHFCSVKCVNESMRTGNTLDKKRRDRNFETYGVEHPMKTEEVQEKFQRTMQKKYNVNHPSESPELLERRRHQTRKRTGFDFPLQDPAVREKRRETMIEKYGAEHTFQADELRARALETIQERFDVVNISQSDHFKEKFRQTMLERHGVEHPMKIPSVVRKGHETKKRNGSYARSRPEDVCYEFLLEIFGADDVTRQANLPSTKWPIDFHITSIDLWIQVDGVYWHGLDRPLDVIMESQNPPDERIRRAIIRDRSQNEEFRCRNLLLVRLTDLEIEQIKTSGELLRLIESRCDEQHHTP